MVTFVLYLFTVLLTYLTLEIFDLTLIESILELNSNSIIPLLQLLGIFLINRLLSVLIVFPLFFVSLCIPFDRKSRKMHWFMNQAFGFANHLLNMKTVVSGKENIPNQGEKFCVMSNHIFDYDIIAISLGLKKHSNAFIAKQSLFKIPLVGKYMKKSGTLAIDPHSVKDGALTMIQAIKQVKEGQPMVVFPEGMRTYKNEMTEFKPGAFKLATKSKAKILPVTVIDTYNASRFPLGVLIPFFPFPKKKAYVHFHPAIEYDEFKELSTQDLSAKVKEVIQTKL